MRPGRRNFLGATAALAAAPAISRRAAAALPASRAPRALVIGGGWGGLAAARHLRQLAPELDVVLVEREPAFWSLPLSNQWLAGLIETKRLRHDYGPAARTFGYRFLQAEVTAVDRARREVLTDQGTLGYDWLVLAVGIREDWAAWFGDDARAIEAARRRHGAAYVAGADGREDLRSRLDGFTAGDLLMTIPPAPYRCPPAPYERAVLLAARIRQRGLKARLTVVDPGSAPLGFQRLFAERYRDEIAYLPHARIRAVDPFGRRLATDVDEFRFDEAILMPPQQAGDLVWRAGLIGRDAAGGLTGWAEADPLRLHARDDERVFLVGDQLGAVSPLFGHYPKSGQIAARLGRIAAGEIAARLRGTLADIALPDGVCHVLKDYAPMEAVRVESQFRRRGDGLIVQTARQHHDAQPRGEDWQWARGMFAELLGYGGD